ncbi:hypothetical protein BC827DRAFT_1215386 [Russula dissimulans]|nr:hypothetical protein BC827DRAFT_1215386 [Russula dissimulans]
MKIPAEQSRRGIDREVLGTGSLSKTASCRWPGRGPTGLQAMSGSSAHGRFLRLRKGLKGEKVGG